MKIAPVPDREDLARMMVGPGSRADVPPTIALDDPGADPLRLEDLPRELGVLLASVGVLGVVLPGVAGAPALIAGGLVLWPETFGKFEGWLQGRFPAAHRQGMRQIGRFLDDLGRRYPHAHEPQS